MHLAAIVNLQTVAPAAWAWVWSSCGSLAQNGGTMLVASIWQGAVIVCGLEIATRLGARISAAHRFTVWAAGFAVAFALPLLSLVRFGSGNAVGHVAEDSIPAKALLQIDVRWGLAIAGLWVVAAAIRFVGLAVHSIRLRRLWKTARPVQVNGNLVRALESVRGGRVGIFTTNQLDRPSVIGFFAPRVLIPEWLIERLTPGELEQIVQHEAEHLRRRDDWTNLVQKLALAVFPLNPALAWMEHRLCREREMACDEGVVRITNAPRAYAACLASLAEYGLERKAEALSLGAWHKRSELVHRVHGILTRKRGMSRAAAGALLGTFGFTLAAGTVEMARCPQLVVFVPEHKTVAMTPARQEQLQAMLAQEDAESKIALPPGYKAVQAKATVPAIQAPSRSPRPVNAKTKAIKNSAPGMAFQTAKSQAGGDRVISDADQQWVVLAAWEEVHTVSRQKNADTTADFYTSPPAAQPKDAAGNGGSMTQNPVAGNYTVTQLILRVVPANRNSKSTQPSEGMVRGGWLVIQL